MVSGYDQPILDPDDENPDDRWLRDQHPRHDDLLSRLLDRLAAPSDAKFLIRLIPEHAGRRRPVVAAPLAALVNQPRRRDPPRGRSGTRLAAPEAGGEIPNRSRRRSGIATRRRSSSRRKGWRWRVAADGLNVLLASIDFATDLDVRRGAVLALGELADEGGG